MSLGIKYITKTVSKGEDFDSVITENDTEDSLFVCDECGKKSSNKLLHKASFYCQWRWGTARSGK